MWEIHDRVRSVAELEYTPRFISTHSGQSLVIDGAHCWDLTMWVDGEPALFSPTTHVATQLTAAGQALAALHRCWGGFRTTVAPCAAVERRLKLFAKWEQSRFSFTGRSDDVTELLPTLELVRLLLPTARAELGRFATLRSRIVGIHGDFWPENVLFRYEQLTCILDFGNVGFDHPEVDLGRLFADVPGADRGHIDAAVSAYNANAPFDLSVPLVELLATTGRLGSLANWHLRLNADSPDRHLLSVALPRIRRLAALVSSGTGSS
jgi:Ser/Thr protein kinase RdoA (MazF antagonist)